MLVFGSVATPLGTLDHPTIRFVHETNQSTSSVLWSLKITNGDRFYAALLPPPGTSYLDAFNAEIGSAEAGFDRMLYVRLRQADEPLAMYAGEIGISPARNRTEKVAVNIRDDFQNATKELKRLYPHFEGTITKTALLSNPVPRQTPPRVLQK